VDSLTACRPADAVALARAVGVWLDAGGEFFEAVVGEPIATYGPRLTLTPPEGAVLDAYADHPWGPPTWLGLRVGPDGTVIAKPYHRVRKLGDRFTLPAGVPRDIRPVMAAWHGETKELYLRSTPAERWSVFAAEVAALVDAVPPACVPCPRPSAGSFAFSLRWISGELSGVTLFADDRSLPHDDDEIARAWIAGMDAVDREAYLAAYAGVCAFAPSPTRARHAMLGWTIEADGQSHRAASLRVLHRRGIT
jgi:hypothetical protein